MSNTQKIYNKLKELILYQIYLNKNKNQIKKMLYLIKIIIMKTWK